MVSALSRSPRLGARRAIRDTVLATSLRVCALAWIPGCADSPSTGDGPSTGHFGADHDAESGSDAGTPTDAQTAAPVGPTGHREPTMPVTPDPGASNEIESVAFDQSKGGRPIPLLLYPGGYASFNVELATTTVAVAEDILVNPDDWHPWRRTSAGVEIEWSSEWMPVHYRFECAAQRKGTRLSGTYEHRETLNLGVAVEDTVARYRFRPDGTFESCEVKEHVASNGFMDRSNVKHSGRYEVSGYSIRFVYADGGGDTLPFFYYSIGKTALWVEKTHFVPQTADDADICVAP